jgi:D-sedoheptulose 7-phosphate isomerase
VEFNTYSQQTIENLSKLQNPSFISDFGDAVDILLECVNSGGKILICGNGGSHSDALHFAGELVNYFTREHRALPVIALGTNGAVSTAWSNDHSFEEQFAREVEAYGSPGSVLIGITTSGKSKNVNRAFTKAKEVGLKTIALSSQRAKLNLPSGIDCILSVPVEETHKIQECHIVIYHAICIAIEESL